MQRKSAYTKPAEAATERYEFEYRDRIATLGQNTTVCAISILIVAQVIYFNLHFIVGATLTLVAILCLLCQVVITVVETIFLERRQLPALHRTFSVHFWLNHAFTLAYMPLVVWAVVIMYQRAS